MTENVSMNIYPDQADRWYHIRITWRKKYFSKKLKYKFKVIPYQK